MKFVMFVVITFFLGMGFTGCTQHYASSLALKENRYEQMKNGTGVAGVLDRRGISGASPMISVPVTKLLVEKAKVPDVSGQLKADEIMLLLSSPVELAVAKPQLHNLRQRLGYRFVIVGEQGGDSVMERAYWDVGLVIPAAVVIIYVSIPVEISRELGVMHATRVLRVIDLEQAQIVGESYTLLRDHRDEGEFTGGEIADGLASIKLAKE